MRIFAFFKFRKYIFYIAGFFLPAILFGAVMQSSSYKIQSDSLNIGGTRSTSTNYTTEDTVGEVGSGLGTSTSYTLNAGYQAMQGNYIAITSTGDITLPNGSLSGISGGTSVGSSTWTVITDDAAGYQMSVQSLTSPALKSASSSFADYVPALGVTPDYNFTYGTASSTFGFSPEGVDITSTYRNDGSNNCNAGVLDTPNQCWAGFSTTPKIIAQSSAANHPNGATTTIKYEAAVGTSKIQDAGTYTSTVTVTAIAL